MIPFKTRIKSGVVQRLEVIESLSFQGQELTPGAATDEKTKVSSNDTTAGYLNGKLVAGSGIVLTENNNGGNETLTISANAVDLDVKVSVSANDTTAGYLNGKLVAGTNVAFVENNNGGDETLTINVSAPVTSVNTKTGAVTLTATDVGAAATVHTHAASDVTSGVFGTARLANSGTASSSTFLRGDQTWAAAPVTSVNGSTGAVSVTTASIGAAPASHNHDASAITSGTIATARLATSGTASSSTFLRGDQTWASAGVTGFTSSISSSLPNNAVNASRLLVDVASSSGDAVIQPKSLGAFQLALADNTATGGNKRGIAAIDLQIIRSNANQVAGGTYAVAIGTENRVDGTQSTALGHGNILVPQQGTILGNSNLISAAGTDAQALGNGNTISSARSVAIGRSNIAGFADTLVMGNGAQPTSSNSCVLSLGNFSGTGDSQVEQYMLKATTTNAAQTTLVTDTTGSLSSTNRLFIQNDSTYIFLAYIVARRTDVDNESLGYIYQGVVDNNSNFVDWVGGAPTTTMLIKDSAPWGVSLNIDNTNKAINIQAIGEAGKTIRWMAYVKLIKVRG